MGSNTNGENGGQCKRGETQGRTEVQRTPIKMLKSGGGFSTHPPTIFHQLWTISLFLSNPFNILYMFNLHFYDHLLSLSSAYKCTA